MQRKQIIVGGLGFTASKLIPFLTSKGYEVVATSRDPENSSHKSLGIKIIQFDYQEPNTYKNLPYNHDFIATFAMDNLDAVIKLSNYCKTDDIRIKIVLGTTSSFIASEGTITESSEKNLNSNRVKCENYLKEQGSNLLNLSGIYGYERSPYNWLNKGLIKNSNKRVNLIHVDDIVQVIEKVLVSDLYQNELNLSDGISYIWKDLWKSGIEKNLVYTNCPPNLEIEGKYISNQKLVSFMGQNFKFYKSLYL